MSALAVPAGTALRAASRARWLDRAATALLAVAAVLLLALVAGRAAGIRPLVERSGSMAPAIVQGDLLLSRPVAMRSVRVGDVVSFPDSLHPGVPTTHRVVALSQLGPQVEVTTRGDANPAAEQWWAPVDGRTRRVALRIPRAGYAVSALEAPLAHLVLLGGACVGLGVLALRRIWSS